MTAFDLLEQLEQDKITQLRQDLQTSDKFRLWLMGLPTSQPVGLSRTCDRCPLAEYLKGRGIQSPIVRQRGISHSLRDMRGLSILLERDNAAHGGELAQPRWIEDFLALLDDEYPITQEITAAKALEMIEFIRKMGLKPHRSTTAFLDSECIS